MVRPVRRENAAADAAVSAAFKDRYQALLATVDLGNGPLAADQVGAALAGLDARVQLLQGPPGTGKTQTTAAATLLRILARRRPGDIVLVAANTHTAVDTLLRRISALQARFAEGSQAAGFAMPVVRLAKVGSSAPDTPTGEGIDDLIGSECESFLTREGPQSVVGLGGTPNALLKWAKTTGRAAQALVVDEASMMVLPYFLALASLVAEDGEILLAGDHRQLAPIMAHDWEREERPPVRVYEPYVSAYEAVRTLKQRQKSAGRGDHAVGFDVYISPAAGAARTGRAALQIGWDCARRGRLLRRSAVETTPVGLWERVWRPPTGVFLVVHDERESRQSNPLEAQIIGEILQAAGPVPQGAWGWWCRTAPSALCFKRRWRGLRRWMWWTRSSVFKGASGRPSSSSATASDPTAIAARAEFLLGLNRANVAFSRAQRRLIVVCAETFDRPYPAECRALCRGFAVEVSAVGVFRAGRMRGSWGARCPSLDSTTVHSSEEGR